MPITYCYISYLAILKSGLSCHGDRMVVGFTTTYAITAYCCQSCEFDCRSWRGVLDTTL